MNHQIIHPEKIKESIANYLRLLGSERFPMQLDVSFLQFRSADLQNLRAPLLRLEGIDLRSADLISAVVDRPDWLDTTLPTLRSGADWIKQQYTVSQEAETITDWFGFESQGYRIRRISEEEE